MKHHEEQCFMLQPTALELSQNMHQLYIGTKQLTSYWTFSLPMVRLANHLNTFLIAYFSYKLSIVRLSLVKESCAMVNTAIHQMIPLSVMVIATETEQCISLHSCTDVTLNAVENIYNPLFLHDHKTNFLHSPSSTANRGWILNNLVKYMYLILHRRSQHQNTS